MRALSGAFSSPAGGGTTSTMRSRTCSTLRPVLALTSRAREQSRPMISSISCLMRGTSALGRSILFRTGMISRLWSRAR